MDQALIALYHRHIAATFDRQMRFADFLDREKVSGSVYQFTTSTATLEFGSTVRFVALDLGSTADPDNSWLWAWSHPQLNLTPANRALGDAVHQLGEKVGSPPSHPTGRYRVPNSSARMCLHSRPTCLP